VQFHDLSIGILALGAVLGLIWLAQRGARAGGLGRGSMNGRLRLVQSLALDTRRRVLLLQCDGREILLLTGGPTDLLLSSPMPPDSRPAEQAP
jgi:flagellar protein FliO/FliZ